MTHKTKGQGRGKTKTQRYHPRDGSLRISNPARTLGSFSGYDRER